MDSKRLRAAVIGTGFMGRVHLEALRRLGFVDVAAVVGSSELKARALAEAFGVPHAASSERGVLDDPAVDAIHICTPNVRHFAMASAALDAGKHVLCEKPLAMTRVEAAGLVASASAKALRNCTCYNLRYYPAVQHMRRMREAGDLGDILIVQGTYSQDWLLYETDWNWRVDSRQGGALRAMGDIGTHWCDMAEHVTGLPITAVCADLKTVHRSRKRPAGSSDTFATQRAASGGLERVAVDTEDYGGALLHLGDDVRGAFTVSQVSAGRKNRLNLEVYGTKASVAWDQERPDELWIGHRDRANAFLLKDPALLAPAAGAYAELPGGHSEGYDDTFKQLFRRFYGSILNLSAPADYPQFADGLRQMRLLDAVADSHQRRGWVEVTT